jgi:uroporphyrinogen-III synthase
MHVLITRPEGDGETLKRQVEQLGYRATLAPLIDIVPESIPLAALTGATALIVTSRNALKALAASGLLESATALPIYVVGPGTAAMARDLGFKEVVEGPGTGADLVPILSAAWQRKGGTFVHLGSNVLAFDLKAALAAEGVNIRTQTVYRATPVQSLGPDVLEALGRRDIDAVILMSPKTAQAWVRVTAADSAVNSAISGMTYLCISDAVAAVLRAGRAAENLLVAARPNLEEMLALMKRLAAHSGTE